jgi:hypothetical protein
VKLVPALLKVTVVDTMPLPWSVKVPVLLKVLVLPATPEQVSGAVDATSISVNAKGRLSTHDNRPLRVEAAGFEPATF